jgi:hypothetical protein
MTKLLPLVKSTVTPSYNELALANTDSRIYVNIISKTHSFNDRGTKNFHRMFTLPVIALQ